MLNEGEGFIIDSLFLLENVFSLSANEYDQSLCFDLLNSFIYPLDSAKSNSS